MTKPNELPHLRATIEKMASHYGRCAKVAEEKRKEIEYLMKRAAMNNQLAALQCEPDENDILTVRREVQMFMDNDKYIGSANLGIVRAEKVKGEFTL